MTIRIGTKADLPALLDLIKLLAEYEKSAHEVIVNLEQMLDEFEYFHFLVSEVDGEIVAIALYYYIYSTWKGKSIYLEDLIVKNEYRNKGIGSKLLDELFLIAKKENCGRIKWQVLDWNTPSIAFYEKIGAQISKEWLNCDFYQKDINDYLQRRNLL